MSACSEAGTGPLRVIQCFRAPLGGLFRHVCDLTRGLNERGIEVGLFCDAADHGELEAQRLTALGEECALGIRRFSMSRLPSPRDAGAIAALRRFIGEARADIVHGHGAKGGAYARIAGRLAGRPCVYTPHGGSLHYSGSSPAGLLYLSLERMLRGSAGAVLFESAYARDTYRHRIGAPPAGSRVIHNGLGPAEFDPVEPGPDAFDLLFIGEIRTLKGPFVLIKALELLGGRGLNPSLLIIGRGPEEEALRAAIPPELGARITFSPPCPAREAFARARVIVAPSLAESLPYIVLEAGAAGVPMIASRVGGIPEIFGPSADQLVAPGDAAALAAAIASATGDWQAARRRALALRAHIKDAFSAGRMVDAIAETYREVLAGASPALRAHGRSG